MRGYNTTCVKIAHYPKHDKYTITSTKKMSQLLSARYA